MTDEQQRRVLDHYTGPMLAIAGPGSGKTYALTRRIRELITVHHEDPSSILVITFTKSAAMEMQQRFYDLMSYEPAVIFGTFHSVFFTMLNEKHHFRPDDVLTEYDRKQIFQDLISRRNGRRIDVEGVAAEVSYCVNSMADRASYTPKSAPPAVFWAIYDDYRRIKRDRHVLDFDDMLLLTYEMLRDDAAVLSFWQKRFRFLLIDEFQDVNRLQYEVLRLLAPDPSSNLFAVGDDDQSIYGFRGSDPSIMKRFPEDYPGCEVVVLSTNYRSGPMIVQKAALLIAHNGNRFSKSIVPASNYRDRITMKEFETVRDEAVHIVNILRRERGGDITRSTAVLFRNHAQATYLVSLLKQYRIPYYEGQHFSSLSDHFIYRDIRSYLAISCGLGLRADFLRVMNRPVRYISRFSVESERGGFAEMMDYYRNNTSMTAEVARFCGQCQKIGRMRPVMAISYIRRAMHYDTFLASYSEENDVPLSEFLEILESITDLARSYSCIRDLLTGMERIEKSHPAVSSPEESQVSLYTYHGAKGLEFQRVFLIDCNEGYTPSPKVKEKDALEEERRMFYVAVTRAKQELHLYVVKKRRNALLKPSRFLREMQSEESKS